MSDDTEALKRRVDVLEGQVDALISTIKSLRRWIDHDLSLSIRNNGIRLEQLPPFGDPRILRMRDIENNARSQ